MQGGSHRFDESTCILKRQVPGGFSTKALRQKHTQYYLRTGFTRISDPSIVDKPPYRCHEESITTGRLHPGRKQDR